MDYLTDLKMGVGGRSKFKEGLIQHGSAQKEKSVSNVTMIFRSKGMSSLPPGLVGSDQSSGEIDLLHLV